MRPSDVVDTLVKIMKEAVNHPSVPLPDPPASVLALVKGKMVGLTTLQRKGEGIIVER